MEHRDRRAAPLPRCWRLNALALAFSLAHVMADYGLVAVPGTGQGILVGALALAGGVYGWWGWSMAQAAGDGRSGLVRLLLLAGGWAGVNGATRVLSPLTRVANVIHFGSLLFGLGAAYATWQVRRASTATPATVPGL